MALHMAVDGSVQVDSAGMVEALKPLLNEAGLAKLTELIAGRPIVALEELKTAGIDARFDRMPVEEEPCPHTDHATPS